MLNFVKYFLQSCKEISTEQQCLVVSKKEKDIFLM